MKVIIIEGTFDEFVKSKILDQIKESAVILNRTASPIPIANVSHSKAGWKKTTLADREQILSLANFPHSYSVHKIADITGFSSDTIRRVLRGKYNDKQGTNGKHSNHNTKKLSTEKINEVLELLRKGALVSEISKTVGVSISSVSRIKKRNEL